MNGLMKRTFAFGLASTMVILLVAWLSLGDDVEWPMFVENDKHGHWVSLRADNTNGGLLVVNWSVTSNLRGTLGGSPGGKDENAASPFDRRYDLVSGEVLRIKLHAGVVFTGRVDFISCLVMTDQGQAAHDRFVKREDSDTPDVNCNTKVSWAG